MATLPASLATRLAGLLAGTYTAGGRYVTGATFTAAGVWLPQENPEWPDVVEDRTWALQWSPPDAPLIFDTAPSDGYTNTYQGPHIRGIGARLLVSYQAPTPDDLAPRNTPYALDPLATVSARATADAERLMWILSHAPCWDGVAIGCQARTSTGARADRVRYVQTLTLTWIVARSAVTAPEWG